MAFVETNGIGDSALYAQVMAGLKGSYDNYGRGNGNYPNVKDILTDRALYNVWMRQLLNARIFADGKGFTSRTAQAERVSSVRVPIMAPPAYAPRTIALQNCATGGTPGTPGNDGLENTELPETLQTDGVDIYFTQIYDKAHLIYKLSQDMVSLPLAAERTRQIPEVVANMEDTTILATQLVGGLARAAATENSNIVPVNLGTTTEGYLQGVMNKLIGTMTNPQTSWAEGAVYYPLEECIIIMKQSFYDRLFTIGNGVLLNANLAQEMLLGGAITKDGEIIGRNIRGMYSSVWIKVVPDSYWRQAAAYAGVTASTYSEFDKVQAYIANAEGTGFGRASTEINPIPNPGNAIGTKIQNLWRWGAGVTRPSSIGLIVATENNLVDFNNPIDANGKALVAPANFNEVIKSYGFANANYGHGAKVAVSEHGAVAGTLTSGVFAYGGASYKFSNVGNDYTVTGVIPYEDADATLGLAAGNRLTFKIASELVKSASALPTGNIGKITRSDGTTQEFTASAFEDDGSLVVSTNVSDGNPVIEIEWVKGIKYTYTFDISLAEKEASS